MPMSKPKVPKFDCCAQVSRPNTTTYATTSAARTRSGRRSATAGASASGSASSSGRGRPALEVAARTAGKSLAMLAASCWPGATARPCVDPPATSAPASPSSPRTPCSMPARRRTPRVRSRDVPGGTILTGAGRDHGAQAARPPRRASRPAVVPAGACVEAGSGRLGVSGLGAGSARGGQLCPGAGPGHLAAATGPGEVPVVLVAAHHRLRHQRVARPAVGSHRDHARARAVRLALALSGRTYYDHPQTKEQCQDCLILRVRRLNLRAGRGSPAGPTPNRPTSTLQPAGIGPDERGGRAPVGRGRGAPWGSAPLVGDERRLAVAAGAAGGGALAWRLGGDPVRVHEHPALVGREAEHHAQHQARALGDVEPDGAALVQAVVDRPDARLGDQQANAVEQEEQAVLASQAG